MSGATCKSCGAPILWSRTNNGKAIPLDREPVEDGTVALVALRAPDTDPIVIAVTLNGGTLDWARRRGTALYRSHFVTCPDSEQHRR